jgi:predicted SnoaL-like aldol condensation-catalyzing enzyme
MTNTNKDMAVRFLQKVVAGEIREAYAAYVDPHCRCHNPYFADSPEDLMRGMEENHERFPNKVFEVQRAIAEGDLVAVHSRLQMKAGDPDMAVVHIFRFSGGKVVEFWDVAQPAPAESPNQGGMF